MTDHALVVEDHPLYRGALAHLARSFFGESAVVEATTTEEALHRAASVDAVRLVLLDFRLPGIGGAEAVRALRRRCPAAAIVVVSASEDRRERDAAVRAGADAFVSKSCPTEVLMDAVRTILAGGRPDPRWGLAGPITRDGVQDSALSPRQLEVLGLLCQGLSNKEISLHLNLALITVKMHVSAVFRVLGVLNRTQAVLAARRLGLYGDSHAER
jgi:DNA-binding NarL/FixJ family response regulator